jgi:hypothetical protein
MAEGQTDVQTTPCAVKSPLASKINIIAALAIAAPYANQWLSQTVGAPVIIEPEGAYNAILMTIIVVRTLWTQAKLQFS